MAQAAMNHILIETNLYGLGETKIEFQTSGKYINTILESEDQKTQYQLGIVIEESEQTDELKLSTSLSKRPTEQTKWVGFSDLEATLSKGNSLTLYKQNDDYFKIALK